VVRLATAESVFSFPPLAVLRARLTYRLLAATTLPAYKGALLRGGFGYAFQRACCTEACWRREAPCSLETLCPYRWVFETPHPPDIAHLHDLHDVPRPFVIEPPLDHKRQYAAGESLEFGLILIGRGVDYLPYFLHSFEQLGHVGLGRTMARAQLERVEALPPFRPVGVPIYRDGRLEQGFELPLLSLDTLIERAAELPADLHIELPTPLRVKTRGQFIDSFDIAAIVQAVCWRINALSVFHGPGLWNTDYRPLVTAARDVRIGKAELHWVDWERTSTRTDRSMKLGGIVGQASLYDVPVAVRAALLAANVLHVGKACVFGHGRVEVGGSIR
jgi:hypothetical protein